MIEPDGHPVYGHVSPVVCGEGDPHGGGGGQGEHGSQGEEVGAAGDAAHKQGLWRRRIKKILKKDILIIFLVFQRKIEIVISRGGKAAK